MEEVAIQGPTSQITLGASYRDSYRIYIRWKNNREVFEVPDILSAWIVKNTVLSRLDALAGQRA